jgi:hypothetical protein
MTTFKEIFMCKPIMNAYESMTQKKCTCKEKDKEIREKCKKILEKLVSGEYQEECNCGCGDNTEQ